MNDAEGAAERVTVTLTRKAAADLQRTQERTGLGKTGIVNRAISAYAFLDQHMTAGAEVVIRFPDRTERTVTFL